MKKTVFLLLIILISIFMLPAPVSANSAEPPIIIIIANRPPADFSATLVSDESKLNAIIHTRAWEGYYLFYGYDIQKAEAYTFAFTADGEHFEITLDAPPETYNNIYTLNIKERTLTPGTYPYRSALLIALRVILTLLIEGLVFLLFGYRSGRSWLIFVLVNLVTQGLLNIWLNSMSSLLSPYIILALYIGEAFVIAAEMAAFPLLLKERKKGRAVLYAFVANLVSMILGGIIVMSLPV